MLVLALGNLAPVSRTSLCTKERKVINTKNMKHIFHFPKTLAKLDHCSIHNEGHRSILGLGLVEERQPTPTNNRVNLRQASGSKPPKHCFVKWAQTLQLCVFVASTYDQLFLMFPKKTT